MNTSPEVPVPGDVPSDPAEYDKWFRAKVAASLADPRPGVPHEEAMAHIRGIIASKRTNTEPGTD